MANKNASIKNTEKLNWLKFLKYLAKKLPTIIFAVLKRIRRVGQGVKTPPFHGGVTGSIPVRATSLSLSLTGFFHASYPQTSFQNIYRIIIFSYR